MGEDLEREDWDCADPEDGGGANGFAMVFWGAKKLKLLLLLTLLLLVVGLVVLSVIISGVYCRWRRGESGDGRWGEYG